MKKHRIIFENTHKSLSIRSWIKPVSTEILEGATCLYPEWIFTDKETFLKPLSIQTKARSTWNQEVSLARGFTSFRLDFLFSERNCKKQQLSSLSFLTYINMLDLQTLWILLCKNGKLWQETRQERTKVRSPWTVKFVYFRKVLIWSQIHCLFLWTFG